MDTFKLTFPQRLMSWKGELVQFTGFRACRIELVDLVLCKWDRIMDSVEGKGVVQSAHPNNIIMMTRPTCLILP